MTKPTAAQVVHLSDTVDRMVDALAGLNLPVLAAEAADLVDYISAILAPPDPYADRALRPGLRVPSSTEFATLPTKSTGDPVFDPTLPKDVA